MKAWEFEHKLTADAVPPELHDDNEADWMAYTEAGRASDKQLFHCLLYTSHHMLIWMKKCLCKQACNTLSHSNQRMAEL